MRSRQGGRVAFATIRKGSQKEMDLRMIFSFKPNASKEYFNFIKSIKRQKSSSPCHIRLVAFLLTCRKRGFSFQLSIFKFMKFVKKTYVISILLHFF